MDVPQKKVHQFISCFFNVFAGNCLTVMSPSKLCGFILLQTFLKLLCMFFVYDSGKLVTFLSFSICTDPIAIVTELFIMVNVLILRTALWAERCSCFTQESRIHRGAEWFMDNPTSQWEQRASHSCSCGISALLIELSFLCPAFSNEWILVELAAAIWNVLICI